MLNKYDRHIVVGEIQETCFCSSGEDVTVCHITLTFFANNGGGCTGHKTSWDYLAAIGPKSAEFVWCFSYCVICLILRDVFRPR